MSHRIIVSVLFIFLLFGCKKSPTSSNNDTSNDNSSITIEWSSSYQATFNSSGQNVHRSFTVTSGSGNFKITAEVTTGDGNKNLLRAPLKKVKSIILLFL